jgi:hypothetical protein
MVIAWTDEQGELAIAATALADCASVSRGSPTESAEAR